MTSYPEHNPATSRVERLRARSLERAFAGGPQQDAECEVSSAESWTRSASEPSHIVRRGRLAGDILRNLTPIIEPDELLVGKYARRHLDEREQAVVKNWREHGDPARGRVEGQRAHMAIDYERLLRLGITGVRDLIARNRGRLHLGDRTDLERDCFYRGCLEALDGMAELASAYAGHARSQAEAEACPQRKLELIRIAETCDRVPLHPARAFREAVQCAHFATFCQCAGNRFLLMQLGRPDRYLWPYYAADLRAGRITPAEAQELLDCLGILLNEYTPRGLAVGWMVGGRDGSGRDVTNDLTVMLVRTAGHVHMAYPGVGLCWTPETPEELLSESCELLAGGCSHPAIFNDDVITSGLLGQGLPHRDACEYIHSTCVEITPVAISNVYVASPYYNLMEMLHEVLGVPTPERPTSRERSFGSFDEMWAAYEARVSAAITQGVLEQNRAMLSRAENGGFPLLSCFVNDCLASGIDIDRGGARANWIESSFVGLANTIDAMAAIRQVVYEQRTFSLGELRQALASDFEGHDALRAAIRRAPKYGNDQPEVDSLASRLTAFLRDECDKHRSYWGGAVVPGFFCWIMHEYLGRQTGASPDGRAPGFPLADGSGPAQGRERSGPTAMVRSVTSWDHSPMLGGIAVNMRFHDSGDRPALVSAMHQVLRTFLELGGFEAQVNVVSPETLRAAQREPDQYRDLVVRIAGYSDYFVGLSDQMQAEIISRSELSC